MDKQFKASVLNTSALNMLRSKHKGSTSQTNRVEAEHPTKRHQLYRRATSILGDDATFTEVASQMNLLSTVDEQPTMSLNKWSLLWWFKKQKGKERRAVFRPLLKEEHKRAKIQYINEICTLQDQGATIGYEDEA